MLSICSLPTRIQLKNPIAPSSDSIYQPSQARIIHANPQRSSTSTAHPLNAPPPPPQEEQQFAAPRVPRRAQPDRPTAQQTLSPQDLQSHTTSLAPASHRPCSYQHTVSIFGYSASHEDRPHPSKPAPLRSTPLTCRQDRAASPSSRCVCEGGCVARCCGLYGVSGSLRAHVPRRSCWSRRERGHDLELIHWDSGPRCRRER